MLKSFSFISIMIKSHPFDLSDRFGIQAKFAITQLGHIDLFVKIMLRVSFMILIMIDDQFEKLTRGLDHKRHKTCHGCANDFALI